MTSSNMNKHYSIGKWMFKWRSDQLGYQISQDVITIAQELQS